MKINIAKNLIIQKITGLSKEQLFLTSDLDIKNNKDIQKAFSRLDLWEPLEYIINNAEFYGLDFYVDNNALIPRDDTEIMVESVLSYINKCDNLSWLFTLIDVWTWTSWIPISIIKNTENISNCLVVDISKEALEVSKINIDKYELNHKITQINWDLLYEILCSKEEKLENKIIITANLPYIKDEDYKNMDESVIKYEPKLALYGWKKTWFEMYQKLIEQCLELKKRHVITLFIEIGFDQKQIAEDFLNKNWLKYNFFKDNNGIDRCIKISL